MVPFSLRIYLLQVKANPVQKCLLSAFIQRSWGTLSWTISSSMRKSRALCCLLIVADVLPLSLPGNQHV